MQILEDHNKQLESQLHRLRELLLQVLSGQGSGEAHPWGGLCHNRAGAVAESDGQKGRRTRTEDHDKPLLSPASSRVRWQWFSSLFLGFISISV